MTGLKNTIISFLFIGIFIALFIGLISLLAKIIFFGIIIGSVLLGFYYIKNKIFGPSNHPLNLQGLLNKYFQYKYKKSANKSKSSANSNHGYRGAQYDKKQSNYSRSNKKGRIIDVTPEDND